MSVRFDNTDVMIAASVRTVTHLVRDNLKVAIASACVLERKLPGLGERLLRLCDEAETIRHEMNQVILDEANARLTDSHEIVDLMRKM